MPDRASLFCRYLPADEQSRRWGWRLIDAGHQQLAAGGIYPGRGHPEAYTFDAATGRRVLDEFQIVFLVKGTGHFESRRQRRVPVGAGDAFLLHPGQWHRYGPSPGSLWDEYWVGFDGEAARRLMADFFPPARPVFHGAPLPDLLDLSTRQLDLLRSPRPGGEQVAASLIPQQLALLRQSRLAESAPQRLASEAVIRAKAAILAQLDGRTDFESLARELGLSYTRLRKLFRERTGHAPREFENLIKLNRARDLLRAGRGNVSAVAEALGYNSVYYFSRAYKKQFGHPPSRDAPGSG